MRILFLHHFPLQHSPVGRLVEHWVHALAVAGHEPRLLVMDENRGGGADAVARVVCRQGDPTADLPFEIPYFSSEALAGKTSFAALADRQLADYRDELRRHLDREIDRFDPQVIHAQHIWVQGQLALESGVPYLLNAWGPELIERAADPRYRALADQAAENAGRILVPDEALLREVTETFEAVDERTLIMPTELHLRGSSPSAAAQATASDGLLRLYQDVLRERFGDLA